MSIAILYLHVELCHFTASTGAAKLCIGKIYNEHLNSIQPFFHTSVFCAPHLYLTNGLSYVMVLVSFVAHVFLRLPYHKHLISLIPLKVMDEALYPYVLTRCLI